MTTVDANAYETLVEVQSKLIASYALLRSVIDRSLDDGDDVLVYEASLLLEQGIELAKSFNESADSLS